MVTGLRYILCVVYQWKVQNTSFTMSGHSPYSVHKYSTHCEYEYDMYVSVPPMLREVAQIDL